jgi:DNA-binding MarR family transcriptional regulator
MTAIRATGNHRQVEELLLKLAEFGQFVSAALVRAAGDGETVDNLPIMVLALLDLEGPQRPGDLQERTGLSSGGVTKAVDRLVRRGLVSRDYGAIPDDHRGVLISLTDAGRRHVQAMTRALAKELPRSTDLVRELDRLLPG